jgi:hypothetical protein
VSTAQPEEQLAPLLSPFVHVGQVGDDMIDRPHERVHAQVRGNPAIVTFSAKSTGPNARPIEAGQPRSATG